MEGVALHRLGPEHLQPLYADRLEYGLSGTSVRHLHGVLRRALKDAVRWGFAVRNVADLVTPPSRNRREMQTLSPEQVRTFLDAATGDRLEALYVVAVTTGMRQGELLGLRWSVVDLEASTLQVTGSLQRTPDGLAVVAPKTDSSRRRVTLPRRAVEALRRHRVRQAEERLRLGSAWPDGLT